MAKAKVRLSEEEAKRLNGLFKDEIVITTDFGEGRVAQITKGGIQVFIKGRQTVHPFPIYDALTGGSVRFKENAYQEEMLQSLYEAAKAAGVRTPQEIEQAEKEADKPHVSNIDVPRNVRFVCFFKNVDEDRYLFHMKHVGLKGFKESLEEGFKQDPFVALRETEYYLGCTAHLLLSSFDELLCQVFGECTSANEWSWTEPKSDHLDDGSPHRSVWCKNKDGRRSFIVHSVYSGADMQHCSLMQINISDVKRELFELHTMRCGMVEPAKETVNAFDEVYRGAGGGNAKKLAAAAIPSSSATFVPAVSTSVLRKAEEHGKTQVGAGVPVVSPKQVKRAQKQPKPIRVNEFLVRRSYGCHRTNGHSLEPIRATVSILPKSGAGPYPVEFDAYWCPKCRKYFMGEGTYLGLKRKGYICCKVIEEKDLGTKKAGDGIYGNLASESILHMYGYTVNQQDDLSEAERHTIISFVIENRIQTAQDIAHLLEWLISQRERNPLMSVAVSRWRTDLTFVKRYHKPTRKVQVDRIYAKI